MDAVAHEDEDDRDPHGGEGESQGCYVTAHRRLRTMTTRAGNLARVDESWP